MLWLTLNPDPSPPPMWLQVQVEPLEQGHEVDEFEFKFSGIEKAHVKNDTVTLNKKFAGDHQARV